MRNAATFDDDFGYDEPVRRTAPRKPRAAPTKKKKKKGRRFAFDMHKVARFAAIGMSATLALGIMVNALVMQKGHHPAPLFGKTLTLAGPTPTTVATKSPAPAEKVAAPTVAASESVASDPVAAPVPMPKPRHVDKMPDTDAINRLLQAPGTPVAADKPDGKTVLGAQKALAKLGYALKPNGTLGPATRKAIEGFEKDRHLPVKGELTHRIVKIIAAESGIRID